MENTPVSRQKPFGRPLVAVLMTLVCVSCATTRAPVPAGVAEGLVQLEYKFSENPQEEFGYVRSTYGQTTNRPREKLVAEPLYFSKRPLYAQVTLGTGEDNTYTIALDESRGTRSGYDTLYIDANNNNDLTDDPKVSAKPSEEGRRIEFPVVQLEVGYGDERRPYHVQPFVYAYGSIDVRLYPAGYCEGELAFNDGPRKVMLFDDNANGLFNDLYAEPDERPNVDYVYATGDTLMIDLDADGELEKSSYQRAEAYHLGKYIPFGRQCYEITAAPHGRELTVRESTAECGYVKVAHRNYSAELLGEDGALKLNARKAPAPVGKYQFVGCSFEARDDKDRLWRIVGRGHLKQGKHIEVEASRATKLNFGPPLIAKVSAARDGDAFQFNLSIKGQGGEKYSAGNFEVVGPGDSLPAPRVRVIDTAGKTVAEGRFEYG